MSQYNPYFASYHLWQSFLPAIGKENWHCDRKRGYSKARKEPEIVQLKKLDNIHQKIGILAQRGIYEYHQNPHYLSIANGAEKIANILQLEQESEEVRDRIIAILNNYYDRPILLNKRILELNRGDLSNSPSQEILVECGNFKFILFVAFDCVLIEEDLTIHILDFKTGKNDFDKRQAYVYLLGAQYLYPDKKIIASFYNLETQHHSEYINATASAIDCIKIEMALIAQRHQQELQRYKSNPALFNRVYPSNPSLSCQYCPFNSLCEDALHIEQSSISDDINTSENLSSCFTTTCQSILSSN
jgi:hypothetical protein